jgi:hypothetical protein
LLAACVAMHINDTRSWFWALVNSCMTALELFIFGICDLKVRNIARVLAELHLCGGARVILILRTWRSQNEVEEHRGVHFYLAL